MCIRDSQSGLQCGEVAGHWLETVVLAKTASACQVTFGCIAIESPQIEDHLIGEMRAEGRVEIDLPRRRNRQQIVIQMQAPLDVIDEQLA